VLTERASASATNRLVWSRRFSFWRAALPLARSRSPLVFLFCSGRPWLFVRAAVSLARVIGLPRSRSRPPAPRAIGCSFRAALLRRAALHSLFLFGRAPVAFFVLQRCSLARAGALCHTQSRGRALSHSLPHILSSHISQLAFVFSLRLAFLPHLCCSLLFRIFSRLCHFSRLNFVNSLC
jgi:hypothetical protein